MRWKIDSEYFGKAIKCTFDGFMIDRAMLTVEGARIFLLSDRPELEGCRAEDKRGFKYSFWVAASHEKSVIGLSEVRLVRKYNHERSRRCS